jgi:hypothetical protein
MSNEYKEYCQERYGELIDIMCELENYINKSKKYYSEEKHYSGERLEILNKIQSIIGME